MTDSNRTSRRALASCVVVAALLLVSCGSDDGSPAASSSGFARTPIVLDYSPTLSDVPALMYLAAHPDVELLAVTLAGTGESDCEPGVRNTRSLLSIAGRADVPVACGTNDPMVGSRDWPAAWRSASNNVVGVVLPGVSDQPPVDAEELLVKTLRESRAPVTIVALAPLTNIGRILRADPTLVDHIESIVIMGGAFDVDGNVQVEPTAEWNLYIDPEAVRAVIESGVSVTFVGLDATNSVPGNRGLYTRLANTSSTSAGEAVRQLWAASLSTITSDGWYFWDELAVVAAVDPSVVSVVPRRVSVDDGGATVTTSDAVEVSVAIAADRAGFEKSFLEVFAGGSLPPIEPLTEAESGYVESLDLAFKEFNDDLEAGFGGLLEAVGADTTSVSALLGEIADSFGYVTGAFAGRIDAIDAPDTFAEDHERIVATVDEIQGAIPEFGTAVAQVEDSSDPDFFWEAMGAAAESSGLQDLIDQLATECESLQTRLLNHGVQFDGCVGFAS